MDIIQRLERLEAFTSKDAINEIKNLRKQNDELLSSLKCVKDLITVVRMPNIEYVADAHNKAVEKLRNLLTTPKL